MPFYEIAYFTSCCLKQRTGRELVETRCVIIFYSDCRLEFAWLKFPVAVDEFWDGAISNSSAHLNNKCEQVCLRVCNVSIGGNYYK